MKLPPKRDCRPGRRGFPQVFQKFEAAGYEGAMDLDVIGAFTFPLSKQMGIAAESVVISTGV